MRVFRVALPNFDQIAVREQSALVGDLISLFAGPLQHCRLLTVVEPATLTELEQARRRLALSRPEPWERQGLLEEARLIADLGAGGELRRARHYLVDFADSLTAADLAHWRISATPAAPPLPIPGPYAERLDHMEPVIEQEGKWVPDHSRYKYGILASYQLTRTWDWRHPLAQLIADADGPLVLCVDARRVHSERVAASAEFWEGMVLNGQDRDAAAARQEAEAALALPEEAVHHVRVLVMLLDRNGKRLKERLESLRKRASQYLRVDRLLGYQARATALFGPRPRPGGVPAGHFNTLSRGVAVTAGMWGVGREQPTAGFYVGVSVDDVSRHVAFLNWRGNDAFHGIILGRTGKGKTVTAQALAWRMAEQGVQAIFLEPQGHGRRLAALAGPEHAAYSQLSYENTRINILDVVHANRSQQYDHVLVLLGLLLDPLGYRPRRFTNPEVAAVRAALDEVYATYDWERELLADQSLTPTLDVFCGKLRAVAAARQEHLARVGPGLPGAGPAADPVAAAALALAGELESLYVRGDYARNFNAATNLDLRLTERVIVFDFSRVPERRRALFYYVVLSALQREIRLRPRRRVIFVDEVHYMSQEPALMEALAHMVKTVRTYQCAIVLIDQDLEAFIGVEGAQAESMAAGLNIAAGQFMLNNLSWGLIHGSKETTSLRLQRHYPYEILDSHVAFLTRMGSDEELGKGMAVLRSDGRATTVYIRLRPMEARVLIGS